MTILRGECGHIKSRWDNYDKCINTLLVSGNQPALRVAPGQINLETCQRKINLVSRKWVMVRRRRDLRKSCLIHQTKKIGWDHHPTGPCCPGEDPSRWQLQGYLYPEECKSIGHRSTFNQPPAIHPMDKKNHRLATGQMGIIQEFSSQTITGHWPSNHRSLDLENINTGEVNIHRSPVIRLYINLHLVRVMPWA